MTTHADVSPSVPVSRPAPATLWLLATAVLTLLPHSLYLPLWVSAACAALLGWTGWRLRQGRHNPRSLRWALLLVATALVAGVWASFGYFFGKEPGLAMLALLLCLKLLEGQSARDLRAGVLLALFLQLGLFFDDQTLPVAAVALGGALLATATLIALEDPAAPPRQTLRQGGLLMLQAVPILIVLFVLFPRLPGPLWGLPADANRAVTGLSEEMAPGTLTELTLSSAIALRAEFAGEVPPPAQRYWRGPVLSEFDGRVWRIARPVVSAYPRYEVTGPAFEYMLTVEPHRQRWLLALDYPGHSGPSELLHTSDFQLLHSQPLRSRARFALQSYPATRTGLDESPAVLEAARRLPADSNPRTRALVEQLLPPQASPHEKLDAVLRQLGEARLIYTLSAPDYGSQPIDGFLFDGRRGFCEHFSSAFVFMMRAAGVPARVVTGYLGGEINPIDGTLIVRQSDAHAWAEVWLPGEGWQRIDPTALAAPERLSRGLYSALPASDQRPLLMREGPVLDALRALRHRWDAVSNAWNRNVLGYDQNRQRELLARLGLHRITAQGIALTLSAGLGLVLLTWLGWLAHRRLHRPGGDALDRQWQRFNRILARKGLARLPSEGPLDYAERVAAARPAQAAEVRAIAALYARLRYAAADHQTTTRQHELARRIREFRLK